MAYDHLLKRVTSIIEGSQTATMQEKLDILLALNLDSLQQSHAQGVRLAVLEGSFVFSSWFKRAVLAALGVFSTLAGWGIVVNWDRTGEIIRTHMGR